VGAFYGIVRLLDYLFMDGRAQTSAINGILHGGRPKSEATIRTQLARDYISEQLAKDLPALYSSIAAKALDGDVPAFKELCDRGWGKAVQAIVGKDEEGNDTPLMQGFIYASPFNANNNTNNNSN
jgi:hypothetical protein